MHFWRANCGQKGLLQVEHHFLFNSAIITKSSKTHRFLSKVVSTINARPKVDKCVTGRLHSCYGCQVERSLLLLQFRFVQILDATVIVDIFAISLQQLFFLKSKRAFCTLSLLNSQNRFRILFSMNSSFLPLSTERLQSVCVYASEWVGVTVNSKK